MSPERCRPASARSSQILLDGVLTDAERADQIAGREVRREQRRDVLIARERDGLLRLDDFDVAGDAGGEAVARLRQLLGGQIARARRDLELLAAGLKVEKG